MTNPLLLVAAAFVITGLGELAALLGILFRYAIPRSPRIFHVLLFVPMVLASVSCFVLAWLALSGEQEVAGANGLTLILVFFFAEGAVYWILVSYAVYHHLRGRRCPV